VDVGDGAAGATDDVVVPMLGRKLVAAPGAEVGAEQEPVGDECVDVR
jgi:hypothetical protein